MIETLVLFQKCVVLVLMIWCLPLTLWSDVRKGSGLVYFGVISLGVFLSKYGLYEEIFHVFMLIYFEGRKGFFSQEIVSELMKSSTPLSAVLFVGNLVITLCLFFLSRQVFSLGFLVKFRKERDVNLILKIVSCFGAGLMAPFFLLIVVFWERRKYENHLVTSHGDTVIYDVHYSYFIARLCFLRELLRSRSIKEAKRYSFIHPKVRIIDESLRTGFLVLGGVGSGKTNVIYNWFIRQFLSQDFRLLIYDQKGDFSQALGHREDVAIVSPFLENSNAWSIGRDVNTSANMIEFLDLLGSFDDVQKSRFFIGAFVDFGTAVFMYLKDEKGEDWTFKDLFKTMQSLDGLFGIVKQYRPEAEMFARKGEEIDQARGVIGTIREKLIKVEALARAWQSGQEKIALCDFFHEDFQLEKKILIVRGDKAYSSLNLAFATTFLERCIKHMISRAEGDAKIGVVIDELQTLGRIPSLMELPRVGRSKGVRFVIGTQDWAVTDRQYAELGGKKGIEGNISNKLVGMMAGGDEAESAAKSFKYVDREIWKKDPKTKRWVSQRENNVQAIVSGQLSLPKPTLSRPAYFFFKHADWPILKIAYKIVPLPVGSFKPIAAAWLSDSDILPSSIAEDGEDIGEEINKPAKKVSGKSKDSTSSRTRKKCSHNGVYLNGQNKAVSENGAVSEGSDALGQGGKKPEGEESTQKNNSRKGKAKGRRSGIKIKKFRR